MSDKELIGFRPTWWSCSSKLTNKKIKIYWGGRQQEGARLFAAQHVQNPSLLNGLQKQTTASFKFWRKPTSPHKPTFPPLTRSSCPTHLAPSEVSKLRSLSEIWNKTSKSRAKPIFVHCISSRLTQVTLISWLGFHLKAFLCMELKLILGYFPGTSLIRRMHLH